MNDVRIMSSDPPKVLLLSGYNAASHEYWADQLVSGLSEYDWTVVALPDRHFYWRIRSNAMTFALQHTDILKENYDLIVATSMVDLCNLRGLLPCLSAVPAVLYFHENQFAYPTRRASSNLINAQLTTVYSALSAQHLLFNSTYNRDSFFNGAAALALKMPDGLPTGFPAAALAESAVIPVPVTKAPSVVLPPRRAVAAGECFEIVWNHRWEYDKQPQVFFSAVEKLLARGVNCRVHVMGQSFRVVPDCFAVFKNRFPGRVLTWGYQARDKYWQVLQQAHIVVSSAQHDFQGLGMLEAITAGCIPVAPDRMAYPEYIPPSLLYATAHGDDSDQLESESLFSKLCEVVENSALTDGVPIKVDNYLGDRVFPLYKDCFSSLIGAHR